ncbi:AbiV family abortive infection protein [Pseudoalteromonas sp. 5-MNA-CIBAN-0065]|uniref:AbiV family abortive infection protein n=1 Tax=Pseudoalteromonas sp. 5-MNA-CIBAN-0065 TaxID=3140421 RepID=UPI00332AD424
MSFSLNQIDEYMLALIVNARELLRESEVLFENKAFARSYTLAHIAREEIAKCKILYAAGRRLASGIEVDWKLTMKRLRDHKSKLRQETVENSILAAMQGDEEGFENIIGGAPDSSEKRNDDKNNSLYVGISADGKISLPNKVIDKVLAERNIQLACYAIDEETSFQNKMGRLSVMKLENISDISSVDNMSIEDKKALIKNLASVLVKHSGR